MGAKKVLVTARDALPEKKISVSKEFMLEWMSKYGTAEDVEWYRKVCNENRMMFQSNLPDTEDTYDTSDWAKVRAEFLKRFFPNAYKKKPQGKKKQESYDDRLDRLLATKLMERDQVTLDEAGPVEEPAEEPAPPKTAKGRRK